MKKLTDFTQLDVWQVAHGLVLGVYRVTKGFPNEERFGLVPQMRRAAVSVPANIAEGFKRRSKAEKRNFYSIAQGSLEEVRYYLILSRDLGFEGEFDALLEQADRIGRMLTGLGKSLEG